MRPPACHRHDRIRYGLRSSVPPVPTPTGALLARLRDRATIEWPRQHWQPAVSGQAVGCRQRRPGPRPAIALNRVVPQATWSAPVLGTGAPTRWCLACPRLLKPASPPSPWGNRPEIWSTAPRPACHLPAGPVAIPKTSRIRPDCRFCEETCDPAKSPRAQRRAAQGAKAPLCPAVWQPMQAQLDRPLCHCPRSGPKRPARMPPWPMRSILPSLPLAALPPPSPWCPDRLICRLALFQ